MKSIRRILSFILVFALCLISPAFGESNNKTGKYAVNGGNIYYYADGETVTIEDADEGVSSAVIPDKIGGLPVTTIGYEAFKDCKKLTELSIPESVTDIGGHAFSGTPWLNLQRNDFVTVNNILILSRSRNSTIRIPTGTKVIGEYAFEKCTQYFSVIIPSTVTTISYNAFYGCRTLTDVTMADGLLTIRDLAFSGCTMLKSIDLPNTVSRIETMAFYGCTGLESVSLSPNLTSIEYKVFADCSSLKSIELPGKVKSLGTEAFKGCTKLKSLTVPPTVKLIGKMAAGFDAEGAVLSDFTLKGTKNSVANIYAINNKIPFTAVTIATTNPGATKFKDVPANSWYAQYVALSVSKGLINGKTATSYAPAKNITYAEAIKLAASIHQLYAEGKITLQNGNPWYTTYAEYAAKNNLISGDYTALWNKAITRADFAVIFAAVLPDTAQTSANFVADGAIPDVSPAVQYGPAVYKLYRAGILKGSGSTCSFHPDNTITRGEVAAVTARIIDSTQRVNIIL